MHYIVTEITFDFDELDAPNPDQQQELIDETIGTFWEAEDGDDLIDQISNEIGWCIKTIDYRPLFQA
jgi:hypothetical protein